MFNDSVAVLRAPLLPNTYTSAFFHRICLVQRFRKIDFITVYLNIVLQQELQLIKVYLTVP